MPMMNSPTPNGFSIGGALTGFERGRGGGGLLDQQNLIDGADIGEPAGQNAGSSAMVLPSAVSAGGWVPGRTAMIVTSYWSAKAVSVSVAAPAIDGLRQAYLTC